MFVAQAPIYHPASSSAGIHAFVKEEQREKALTERLLQLQHAEMQLGLPHIDIDHQRGICCLGVRHTWGISPRTNGGMMG